MTGSERALGILKDSEVQGQFLPVGFILIDPSCTLRRLRTMCQRHDRLFMEDKDVFLFAPRLGAPRAFLFPIAKVDELKVTVKAYTPVSLFKGFVS